ncbi:hypothetical protein BC940DRAFT_306603 [Gongronella butleri]|nr:hypothetical protein BC940DRAFT_306603 [Gongronella butleri]
MPQEEDYGCPICLSLLHEPMLFHPCQHRFCGKCTDALFVRAGVSSQFSVSSDGLSLPCPVCRTAVEKSQVAPDQALANWLALYFPLCTPWWKKLYKKCKKMLVFLLNLCCVSPMYFPDAPYDTDDHIHAHAYFIVM